MKIVISREEEKNLVQRMIEEGTSELELIKRAGHALFMAYPYKGYTLIILGKGNNAGDGIALAIEIKKAQKDVSLLLLNELSGSNLLELFKEALHLGIKMFSYTDSFSFDNYSTIVDAIFGIGFHGELKGIYKEVIERVNALDKTRISIDINSGLDANSGKAKLAFKSNLTISVGYLKTGYYLNDGKDWIEEVKNVDIGLISPNSCFHLFEESDLDSIFQKRKNNINKGNNGYVGIMGGSLNYSGSVKLGNLALSTLRSGAGVARLIIPDSICDSVMPYLLEATIYPMPSKDGHMVFNQEAIKGAISHLSSIAYGMGMTVSFDTEQILEYLLLNYEGRLLIDADGINALSLVDLSLLNRTKASIVLTPHLKEFSRLINRPIEEIIDDPVNMVQDFINKYPVTLLLKGPSTIIGRKNEIIIVNSGSPALSKGGSGDILSGIISGIMGFNSDTLLSSASGAFIHGKVGEIMLKNLGAYDAIPRDEIDALKEYMKNR